MTDSGGGFLPALRYTLVCPEAARRIRLAGAVLLLAAFVLLAVASLHRPVAPWEFLVCLAAAWIGFGLALGEGDAPTGALFAVAVLARLAGLIAQPVYEDDWARYLWDGYRFLQDGTPYGVPPAEFFTDPNLSDEWHAVLNEVNHPHVPTIYAPALQVVFAVSAWLAPASLLALKTLLLAADAVVCAVIARIGGTPAALRYALCPLVIFEVAFNAHADIVAIVFVMVAVTLAAARRPFASGAAMGLAVAGKVFALALLPFVLLRERWRAAAAVVLVVTMSYAPFLLQGATERAGLAAFAQGWEFNSTGFALMKAAMGDSAARIGAVLLSLLAGAWILWRWHRSQDRPWPPDAGPLFAVLFLLAPVVNAWYLLWLAPWAALYPAPWRFAAMAAVGLSYLTASTLGFDAPGPSDHPVWVRPLEIALVILVIGIAYLVRTRKS